MRPPLHLTLTLALAVVLIAVHERPAAAIAACNNNGGITPVSGTTLPVRPRIVLFDDRAAFGSWKLSARIDGKPVKLRETKLTSAPYVFRILQVDSAQVGKLEILQGTGKPFVRGTYTIVKAAKLPSSVPATVDRFYVQLQHSTVEEIYDAVALRLPAGTPGGIAHIKLRRDAKASWSELDVPLAPPLGDKEPALLIGKLGCTSNYSIDLLTSGVELVASLTLADGTSIPITVGPRVTAPARKPTP